MIDKYNYNDEPSGRVDTLAMALDKCEKLEKQLKETKSAISSALNFLACADRISETECNEQLAFDVLRKALEELEK